MLHTLKLKPHYHYRTKIFIKNKESEISYGPEEKKKEEQTG